MKISQKGIDLIKRFEGLRLSAYLCPAGVPTIGYGHTGEDVEIGQTITQQRAEELLRCDLTAFEQAVGKLVTVPLRQAQFDALVSFTYNVGSGNLQRSALLRKVNANPSDPSIAVEFGRWNMADGKVLGGLALRRAAEAELYFSEK